MQPFSPAHRALSASTRANRRNVPFSGGFCSWLSSGKSPRATDFGKLSSVLCFSCSGATLLNCCILSTTSSATRTFDPASCGIFEVGEEQVPGCVAGWKDSVVWEQPLTVFTRGGENTRALQSGLNTQLSCPDCCLEAFPNSSLSQAQFCNNHS